MAFQVKNWTRISSSGNADVVTLQDGTLIGAPTMFGYISGTDTLAQIGAADYFADQANEISITDLIYVAGTDGEVFMTVAGLSLGPPASVVTTTVTPGSGDVDGPASSVDYAIALFNGTTGKLLRSMASVGSAGQILRSAGVGAPPAFSTATYPATTTINQLLYSSAANTVAGLATANRAVLTTGATGVPVLTALATDGQVIIGSTAGVPAAATLTAGAGISIVNAGNSITIAATDSTPWVDQTTTPVTIAAGTGYIANNAGLVTLNMPATAAVGDEFQVVGQGAGGWLLQSNTGQIINLGSSPTTVTTGSLASTNRYDGVKLVCTVADTTFVVLYAVGNLTVA